MEADGWASERLNQYLDSIYHQVGALELHFGRSLLFFFLRLFFFFIYFTRHSSWTSLAVEDGNVKAISSEIFVIFLEGILLLIISTISIYIPFCLMNAVLFDALFPY